MSLDGYVDRHRACSNSMQYSSLTSRREQKHCGIVFGLVARARVISSSSDVFNVYTHTSELRMHVHIICCGGEFSSFFARPCFSGGCVSPQSFVVSVT